MERSRDWWGQSQADIRHAKHSYADRDYEWACFASHQAAEKAVKAVFQKYHLEGRGPTVSLLLGRLPEGRVLWQRDGEVYRSQQI